MKKYILSLFPLIIGTGLSFVFWIKEPMDEPFRDQSWLSYFHHAWFWVGVTFTLVLLAVMGISDVMDRVEQALEKRRIDREIRKRQDPDR